MPVNHVHAIPTPRNVYTTPQNDVTYHGNATNLMWGSRRGLHLATLSEALSYSAETQI